MSFEEFIRAAQERAAQPQAPTLADRIRAMNEANAADDLRFERRDKIAHLAEHGATEGERDAARAALARLDAQDEEDYGDALMHGEA